MIRSFRNRAQRLVAVICAAWLVAGFALAQDPKATAAQGAAREWLALADRADAQASWSAAGKKFQAAMADALAKARTPMGSVKSRTIFKTDFTKSFPGAPDGDYALIVYTTSFANKAEGHETLTLERESDGKWRVVGYFIR